ncbi:sulfur oxidation c-type cytochrome SoxA [Betaproteobacteria bacterium GR16-43]|nr:sulfur oxidation c-type cytochrome SoxA [Betaproteobacteria bacterium GR16-43]
MRCPDLRLALAAWLCAPALAIGAAEQVRTELAARFQKDLPALPASDYILGGAAFDPALRARLDENANAAQTSGVLEAGRKLFSRKFKNGRSLASCFPNGGKRVAGAYPQYDSRLKRVVTLETAINQCLKANAEPLYDLDDPATLGAVAAYLRSLSDGQKVAVRVPAAAEERFDQGRRLYDSRMGQQNWACASCHVQGAGKRYADIPLSPAIGQGAIATAIRDGKAVTLQARMRECLERMGVAPFAAGSDELNNLEYYLTYLSNGLVMRPNAWRPAR